MIVELLHSTPLNVCSRAVRTCYDSHHLAGDFVKECDLIERVGNKNKHGSVLEHLVYSFSIDGISRACLQEIQELALNIYRAIPSEHKFIFKSIMEENNGRQNC